MCVCVSPLHPWPLSPLPQNNLCEYVSSCHCPSCSEGTWLLSFHSQSWWHCCLPASPCCQSWGGPISQCQSLRGICWSWDWYGLSTHVCFRLKFLAFFLHSTAVVPKCSWVPCLSSCPTTRKDSIWTISWAFYLSPRLRPVPWALAWRKEEWRMVFTVEDILYPKSARYLLPCHSS